MLIPKGDLILPASSEKSQNQCMTIVKLVSGHYWVVAHKNPHYTLENCSFLKRKEEWMRRKGEVGRQTDWEKKEGKETVMRLGKLIN